MWATFLVGGIRRVDRDVRRSGGIGYRNGDVVDAGTGGRRAVYSRTATSEPYKAIQNRLGLINISQDVGRLR